jgi:hypothetical protein
MVVVRVVRVGVGRSERWRAFRLLSSPLHVVEVVLATKWAWYGRV